MPITRPPLHAEDADTRASGSPQRLLSLDVLRGFDMFWITGADLLFQAFDRMAHPTGPEQGTFPLTTFVAAQLDHSEWAGFHFYDLIFPLFVFIVGVSLVFSLQKAIQQAGRWNTVRKIVGRSILLFVLGVFYWGGIAGGWPNVRLAGVLQRIGICYLAASLMFCFLNLRTMVSICASLLIGYWAVMTYVPIRDIHLEKPAFKQLAQQTGIKDPKILFQKTTNRVTGHFERGHNVADHFDFEHLPGEKYDTYFDPEGLLSTLPAIATCLLGVFAGLFLRKTNVSDLKKVVWLIAAGVVASGLGWLWSLQFPVIEKIWTSSFVLVAGGYSAILLGTFYLIVDVWKYRKWCQPFVWMGMNSITIYLVSAVLGTWRKPALRLVGGDVKQFFDDGLPDWLQTHAGISFPHGSGELVVASVGLLLAFWFVRFLYQKKIFLRV